VVTDGADRLKDGARVSLPGKVSFAAGKGGKGRHGGHHHHNWSQGGDGAGGSP
jgi:membrane fusion protein, multidrug efflux system